MSKRSLRKKTFQVTFLIKNKKPSNFNAIVATSVPVRGGQLINGGDCELGSGAVDGEEIIGVLGRVRSFIENGRNLRKIAVN